MCNNLIPIKAEKVKGYKVVLEKNERQYSPAMGIRYHSGELVKIPKKQIRLIDAFNRGILDPKRCLLYTSPSPRDRTRSRMPSSA